MASAIIHICIAKKINQTLKQNEKELFLGSIAPDISKQINEDRNFSHFIKENELPDIDAFIKKYRLFFHQPFTLGYLIHLLTDYFWMKDFLPLFKTNNLLTFLNGNTVKVRNEDISKIVYNDYTNLNIFLIDAYRLDLSLFYEPFVMPKTVITEIPLDKLPILIDKMGVIIENSKQKKELLFNQKMICSFNDNTTNQILLYLKNQIPIK